MKLDKAQIIVLVVGIVILLGWDPLCKQMGWFQVPVQTPSSGTPAAKPAAYAAKSAPNKSEEQPKVKTPAAPAVKIKMAPAQPAKVIGNKDLRITIDPISASVLDIEFLNYKSAGGKGNIRFNQTVRQAMTLVQSASALHSYDIPTSVSIVQTGSLLSITRNMRKINGDSYKSQSTWKIDEKGYIIGCELKLSNTSKTPVVFDGYSFSGGTLQSWAEVSKDVVRTPSHRMDYMTAQGAFKDIDADDDEADFRSGDGQLVKWAGVSNKYFCLLLTSDTPFTLKSFRKFIVNDKKSAPAPGYEAAIPVFSLNPGESKSFTFKVYAGPKIIADLEKFDTSAGRVMHLAWGPLDYLARLLLWVLVKIHSFGLSYGWSIIVLTIIVRLLFYPATAKANASMKKMQLVQPKLKELKEKYKDNPQLMNAKMMELYRAEGVNPFGGCLPLLLQLPVFIALYTTLDGAVELRQVPFWWSPDLAGPDTICRIPLYFFTLPVNPLVIIMTVLMVVQQHITPMGGDPMQKKMMTWMPVIMLLLFYDLPSGLTLYWSVSNVFSIIQLVIQKRDTAAAKPADAAVKP